MERSRVARFRVMTNDACEASCVDSCALEEEDEPSSSSQSLPGCPSSLAIPFVRAASSSFALATPQLVLARFDADHVNTKLFDAVSEEAHDERMRVIPFATDDRSHFDAHVAREYALWSRGERFNFVILQRKELASEPAGDEETDVCIANADPVGCAGIVDVDAGHGVVQIGLFTLRDKEGKGLAAEALRAVEYMTFDVLGMHRSELRTDAANVRCARLAERCGYQREGVLRENFVARNGQRNNTAIFGKLREEWRGGGAWKAYLV